MGTHQSLPRGWTSRQWQPLLLKGQDHILRLNVFSRETFPPVTGAVFKYAIFWVMLNEFLKMRYCWKPQTNLFPLLALLTCVRVFLLQADIKLVWLHWYFGICSFCDVYQRQGRGEAQTRGSLNNGWVILLSGYLEGWHLLLPSDARGLSVKLSWFEWPGRESILRCCENSEVRMGAKRKNGG